MIVVLALESSSLKWCKIRQKLVLKSKPLLYIIYTIAFYVFCRATGIRTNLMKIDLYYQWQEFSPGSLVSGDIYSFVWMLKRLS